VKLTRRDALAALSGTGIVVGGGVAALSRPEVDGDVDGEQLSSGLVLDTLVAVAEVVYPSQVEGIEPFVETYSLGRIGNREEYRSGVRDAVAQLDGTARRWREDRFTALDIEGRETLLQQLGTASAEPVPDGTIAERIRYYIVNELLYALYTSPTGGELVGIENPQGHPGGTESYQRGPR
jgi:hypothetical protein